MKRVIAIFLSILYFAFLSGALWADFQQNIPGKSFYVDSADAKNSQKSAEDDEINTAKHIVQSRHTVPVIKIKIPRANGINSIKSNIPLTCNYKLSSSAIVNTSPYCNTSLIIRNRVFRI